MSIKFKKQPSDETLPTDDKSIDVLPDAGDSASPVGGDGKNTDSKNEQTVSLGSESPVGNMQDDTALGESKDDESKDDESKDDESKDDESKDDEGDPILTIGLMSLRYTGTESISLDASMVGVYRKVNIFPNQLVLLPEMLGRHWVKKPFFTKVD